ncbi:MAG: cell division protein FtsA [Candidatus Saccharimonadales bacterium]|jgi:cell division protein FtsA
MHDQSIPHYVGIDIGTSTVRCIIGVLDPHDTSRFSIIGYGAAPNVGMRRGVVVYADDVSEAIIQAITEAERLAGVRIHQATVNINGSHISGMNSKGVIAISTANREITTEDRLRVEEAATIIQLPSNREIVQVFAKNYRLDGQDNIKDPVGMRGVRLEVETHIVTAASPSLRNLDAALQKAEVIPNRHTLSGLAAVETVLNRQQKESGTILLDIGAGTTNIVVIEDGEIQHVAVIPMGGVHITNDLAIGLKTDLDIAELVKINHAHIGAEPKKDKISVDYNKKTYHFDAADVVMISEARVEELLDYVAKELHRIQRWRKLPGGVVLVGGSAKLPGLPDFVSDKLELAARVGEPQMMTGLIEKVTDPAAFTAVGLALLDMLLLPIDENSRHSVKNMNTKIFTSLSGLWRSFKR